MSEFDLKAAAWVEKNMDGAHDVVVGSVDFDMHVDTSYCETCGPEHGIEVSWRQKEPKPARRIEQLLWKNGEMRYREVTRRDLGQLIRELTDMEL